MNVCLLTLLLWIIRVLLQLLLECCVKCLTKFSKVISLYQVAKEKKELEVS